MIAGFFALFYMFVCLFFVLFLFCFVCFLLILYKGDEHGLSNRLTLPREALISLVFYMVPMLYLDVLYCQGQIQENFKTWYAYYLPLDA